MRVLGVRRLVAAVILSVVLGCAASQPVAAQSNQDPDVPNFQKVSRVLWRGAAPSNLALKQLADSGIKTVIDLRLSGSASNRESALAYKLGLNYFHIPMGFSAPAIETVNAFLAIATDPKYQPVFVHCRQGADRTGVLVAIYRMHVDGWTFDKCYSEMRGHHFKPWLVGMRRMVAQWEPGMAGKSVLAKKDESSL